MFRLWNNGSSTFGENRNEKMEIGVSSQDLSSYNPEANTYYFVKYLLGPTSDSSKPLERYVERLPGASMPGP